MSKSQLDFFESAKQINQSTTKECCIEAVGKRRDGGTRYWCMTHKADATAKYGKRANHCKAASIPPISDKETLLLDPDKFAGGIALWGAVPAIYDTTTLPLDRGIHVHARKQVKGKKVIDRTYRAVNLTGDKIPEDGINVTDVDAIYYMVSTVFGIEMRHVKCTLCGYSHLDKDWFSVHPHQRHLCAGCGKYFRDTVRAVGNPISQMQSDLGFVPRKPKKSKKTIKLRQCDFEGGIQIWGSNPAIYWSSAKQEEEGIHIHAYKGDDEDPIHDDTYNEVIIDGVKLKPMMVRTLMAQNALPHIEGRVTTLNCLSCGALKFDEGDDAYTPLVGRKCSECGGDLHGSGRLRKVIANPLLETLNNLAQNAPRLPQEHSLGLLPETI